MITPLDSAFSKSKISSISTPRLTPLRGGINRKGAISRLDINELEGKIKAIESQIGQVIIKGEQRRLDKLEKSLQQTASVRSPVGDDQLKNDNLDETLNQDFSLLYDMNDFEKYGLEDIQNYEAPRVAEKAIQPLSLPSNEFQSLSLPQALKRLFQFIEVESNIDLDTLDGNGTYKKLKVRLNQLVNEQPSPSDDLTSYRSTLKPQRKIYVPKRANKRIQKQIEKGQFDNQIDEPSNQISQPSSSRNSLISNHPNSPDGDGPIIDQNEH